MNKENFVALRKGLWLLPLLLFFIIALNDRLSEWVFPGYFLYDVKRILEILLLLWTASQLLLLANLRREWFKLFYSFPGLARIAVLLIFVLGAFSAFFAAIPFIAAVEFGMMFLLLLYALFLGAERIRYGEVVDAVLVYVLLTGVIVYEATFFYFYVHAICLGRHLSSFPGFANIRFFAQYASWLLPIIVLPFFLIERRKLLLRFLLYLIAGLLWALAIANGAKGMFLGLGLAFVFGGIVFRKSIMPWLKIQVQVFAIGFILYLVLFVLLSKLGGLSALAGSMFARYSLWHLAIRMITAHPIFGVGPMHFSHYPNRYAAHPHNSLLLIGAEWGLPVLFLVLSLYLWGLFGWWKRYSGFTVPKKGAKLKDVLPIALTVSLITGSSYSLVSGLIVMPLSQVLWSIVFGWMLGLYYADRKIEIKTEHIRDVVFIIMCGLVAYGLLMGVLPRVFKLQSFELKWAVMHVHKHVVHFAPRMWLQGWF